MASSDTTELLQMLETSADSLRHGIEGLDDDQVASPSALPDWTRGHVLTHVARNADALVNLLTWARTGVETPMYPSRQARDADIEAGAGRPAQEHRADVERSQERLLTAAAEMTPPDWRAPVRWGFDDREGTAELVPWLRLVELEVHHVDLEVGYTPAHWATTFAHRQLASCVQDRQRREDTPPLVLRPTDDDVEHRLGGHRAQAADRAPDEEPVPTTVSGPQTALLAWLIGRSGGEGLIVGEHGGPLPQLAPWR